MLPNVSNFSTQHSDKLVERHDVQLQHDVHGCSMKELPVGSTVGYCDHTTNHFNIGIISEWESPKSYIITTESGKHISQNRIDLKCTNVPHV